VSIAAAQVTVSTSATLLNTTPEKDAVYGKTAFIRNAGTADIFIGPAGVTTATGFKLSNTDAPLRVELGSDDIYGIVATATQVAHVLLTGV